MYCTGLPLIQKGPLINFTFKHCLGAGSISRPSDYDKNVLTSCPERYATYNISAKGIWRNRIMNIL